MLCCICGKIIKGHGHNARPLFDGKCCDECNQLVILTRQDKRKVANCSTKGSCSKCMQCCTDFIPLTQEDIRRIKKYMSTHNVDRNICTDEHGNYMILCPFLSESGCQIYDMRPEVCRGFCCWHNQDDINRNKIRCIAKADINGGKRFASLHAIFWDDWEFNAKLFKKLMEDKNVRRTKEENKG